MRAFNLWHFILLLSCSWDASAARGAESFAQQLAELEAKLSAEPTNIVVLFKLGDLCHDEGAKDNAKAVLLAEKYFKQLLALQPTNAWAMALLGSAMTMKARDAFWPKTKLNHVRDGNKTMDAAVALAPEDAEVRLVRALNNFHMPKFLEREAIVRADFAWLWEKVTANPKLYREGLKQDVALHQGLLLKKQKKLPEAIAVWKQGLAFNPDSTVAKEIREQLK